MAIPADIKQHTLVSGMSLNLLMIAFFATHLAKYGDLVLSTQDTLILLALAVIWLIVSAIERLPRQLQTASLAGGVGLIIKANLLLLFMLSLTINSLQLMHWSRVIVYGSGIGFLILQIGALAVYRRMVPPPARTGQSRSYALVRNFSYPLAFCDFLLFISAFLLATIYKQGQVIFTGTYDDILVLGSGLWLITALVTRKFERGQFSYFPGAMATAVKAAVLLAGMHALFVFGLRLESISRVQVFGTIGLYLLLEGVVFYLYSAYYHSKQGGGDLEDASRIRAFLRNHQKDLPQPTACRVINPVKTKLKHALEFFFPAVYPFIEKNVDLDTVDRGQCALMSTKEIFNLEALDQGRMQLIINLHKINDIRFFNHYFLLAHTRLQPGGCLVGMAHTVATHRAFYASRFKRPFDSIVYALSFFWRRACPKLPVLKKIYFAVTKGEYRIVSRAEILGRLYFCGYKVVAETELNHLFFFIARKVRTPSEDKNPTYGPLVRLKRYGRGGKPIEVFKFRTMFPYSEYLQEYIYEHNNLDKGGKFRSDFRVTGWGRFMRRTWLDELPMLYNWLRGDLQLIGVRPLSAQYLGLYTPELRELRARVKPGLLPPFYADMPETLEDIMASEAQYLHAVLHRPVRTQWRYFWLCVFNIVLRKARSC